MHGRTDLARDSKNIRHFFVDNGKKTSRLCCFLGVGRRGDQSFSKDESFAVAEKSSGRITEVRIVRIALNIADFEIGRGQFPLQRGIVARLLSEPIEIFERVFHQ